jgi:2-oxoglutarate dehydrogenase E1 component
MVGDGAMDEFGVNAGVVAELFERWTANPVAVDESWQRYFERLRERDPDPEPHRGDGPSVRGPAPAPSPSTMWVAEGQGRVAQLINAYRVRGHLFAAVDPLCLKPTIERQLDLANFGLTESDLDRTFSLLDIPGPKTATLREIVARLQSTYCRSIGAEFTQLEDPEERRWLQERMEATQNRLTLTHDEQIQILTKLTDAETFESFIHRNYVGAKRFSLEGAESLIALLDRLVETSGAQGVEEIVIGMAHRGRLNVLANILHKNVREIFASFEDTDAEKYLGSGDVKYHLGYSTDHATAGGRTVHVSLAFNPSHLEWVNPVVTGRVRAKQDRKDDRQRRRVMPLLIHGDAAFMGQGVVAETLNLTGLSGYATGGTLHVVVNNQIGFTTLPTDARSTRYATDITRMLKVPVFHVNGEDPEAVAQVTLLSIAFRQRFGKDVVIDMYCYRRYGHNEADEPRFTQPLMYAIVDQKPSVREIYVGRLLQMGHITRVEADEIAARSRSLLDAALEETRKHGYPSTASSMEGLWSTFRGGPDEATPDVPTAVPRERLVALCHEAIRLPRGFHPNPKVLRLLETRADRLEKGLPIDWATGEMLAYATLLAEGTRVRLSGQDTRRGTFSHRHAMVVDAHTDESYVPLAHLESAKAPFEAYDSPLSEAGVLGFDYGYSLDYPDALVVWEAQFGDFVNAAQVIVDQFIISCEDKWHRLSGLVLYLPHGYEGMGPEHSSARLERFLQQSAEDNIQVVIPTTAAQLFHVLRRQVRRPWRKPLVVLTPKSMLREQNATIDDLANGSFQRVIPDRTVQPDEAKRILLCSGRVSFDLAKAREERGKKDVAIVRLEQLHPLSADLANALSAYPDGTPLLWVQDEPFNMGAWYYLNARLPKLLGTRLPLACVSRPESASPATGSMASHKLEQRMLMDAAFAF